MQPFAFALSLGQLCPVEGGSATQVQIPFAITAGDGVNPPQNLVVLNLVWDAALSVAANLSSLKAAVVNEAATEAGIKISSDNVTILMGAN
jgi:hypothetical protein